jgi:D-alanyl-D-alanine carboxypeptidase/D-alanyl-D-alanine-endopeptidase (penicillin-binding protein 4)
LLCTAADGRLAAKTGSLSEVNTLAGYLDLGNGKGYVFDIMANNHTARSADAVAQMDSLVLALTDRRLKPLAERPTCPPPK